MSKITDYIEKELKKGFSAEKIKETLIKYKYPEKEVDEAISQVKEHEFPQHKWKKPLFWEMVAGIAGLIVLLFLLLAPDGFLGATYNEINNGIELKEDVDITVPECDGLAIEERDICILQLAKEKNDSDFCSAIINTDLKLDCSLKIWQFNECMYLELINIDNNECLLKEAVQSKNIDYCYKTNKVDSCILTILQVNPEINCRNDDYCLMLAANVSKNVGYCSTINDIRIKEKCIYNIALLTKNIGYCLELKTEYSFYCNFFLSEDVNGKKALLKDYISKLSSKENKKIDMCETFYNEQDIKICIDAIKE